MNVQMRYVFPLFIGFLSLKFPAALALYWVVLNLASVVQQIGSAKKAAAENR